MFALQWEMTDTEAWRDEALCRDGSAALTELFFSEQLDDIARAKQFCRACPVRTDVPRGRARAARALGCLGRGAARQREDPRPEAEPGPAAQGHGLPSSSHR